MQAQPVIAIFDIGRTNKKLLVFDAGYSLLDERSLQFAETSDEDGFPTEDLSLLTQWVKDSFEQIRKRKDILLKAVNISAYGASLVHLDNGMNPLTPLYSYMKPFPADLLASFNKIYDSDGQLSKQTASPELGHLNSAMQLYWIKKHKPDIFRNIRYSLHLPQYISFLLSGVCASDLTSIGCHTRFWDFEKKDYHHWVREEGLTEKLARIFPGDAVSVRGEDTVAVGVGLHDSSAALIPYLSAFQEPFILLSTGTWSISLNPFNHAPLTDEELKQDCLCYLSFRGQPVKASRLFAGHDHEVFVLKLADHFQCREDYYLSVRPDSRLFEKWLSGKEESIAAALASLETFSTYEEAYHAGMIHLINQQKKSTGLVLGTNPVKRMFVDGGFSKNPLFMHLMAKAFPQMKVYAASLAQASALGAAQAIHPHWNKGEHPESLLELKQYSG